MKTLKSAAESIMKRCRKTGHRTKLIKRPAILILIAIMITTSVLSPSGLTLGSGGLSPVPVKAAGAEDGTSSGEADNAESSTGSAREETGNTDAGASESEGEKEDKDNTASDVKKGGNDAASQDQGGDTGIAEDAGKGDHEEKSGSANGSSDKKNNETKDAAADSDKSGKKGNEAAGAGSGEKNTSKDSGSGRKNSSDRDNVNENGTEGTTAPENDEIILTETARDKSYTITVRGDKYSGLKNVDKMTVLEITRDDQFYEEFVKKLNKTLNKTTEGQIQDIRLYDIEFTDQNGLPVHLKRNVDVTITYNNYKASPKVEMNQVVRAFIATTVTYYGFFTNVTTSFAKAYASGAGARVSRTGMTGNTAAADRQIKISKTEWIDEKEILTDISRNRINEVTYILPKDGVTGIAVIGKDPEIRKPEQGQGQTEDKGETATEAQTADKIEAGKEAKPEDKSETATETQPEDKSEAATEAQPGDKSEAGKENQPEGENGDGQDSQTGTQKEENSEARTADQTQTSPETQTADQPETGPEAQTGDQNEAGQETQPEKTLTVKGKDYRVTVTYDDKAGLPEGARLTAREIGDYSRSYKNYLSQAESALTKDKQVNTARFFDITIWDGAGNKIEPKAPVRVSIEFDSVDVQDKGNVELIHFEEDKKNAGAGSGKAQILHDVEVQDGEKKDTVDGVSFDIGGFSVFGVLQTVQVLKMTASDGKQYKVTVSYDDTCGIPADAKLIVNEISKTDKRYNDYVDKTAETLGKDAGQFSYAHALDIMLVGQVTGKHYQPTKDVKVSIELLKEDISEDQDVNVVHFQGDEKNTASRMDSKVDEGSVEFETDGFSVYVVVQTNKEQILTASDGKRYKVSVTFDTNSGIPADAELVVSELKKGDKGYKAYVTAAAEKLGESIDNLAFARPFDITLKNPETGEEYQLSNDIQVSIQLLNEDLTDKTEISVVHFRGEADGDSEIMESSINGETVEFETDGFSVYVLIGEDGTTVVTPQCTYTFKIPNEDAPGTYIEYPFKDSQGKTIYHQTVISGDELVVPQLTSTDGKTFAGWYRGEITGGGTLTLETEPYDFDNITITENSAIDLYAVYVNYAAVIFHDKYDSESNTFPIAYTRRAELVTTGEGDEAVTNATVKVSDLSVANTDVGDKEMAFLGWSKKPITTPGAAMDDEGNPVSAVNPDAEGYITVSGETHLYPIYIETYLLSFYAAASGNGAAYNGPRYVNKGDYLNKLPTTSVDGYTFTGWWTGSKKSGVSDPKPGEDVEYGSQITDANGALLVGADDGGVYVSDGKLYLRADTTLYAGWTANTSADYTILYWQQNGTGTDYSYKESVTHTGTVGATVSVADGDKANNRYEGFHLKGEPASAEVKADGSTVLNVYYDHNDDYTPPQGDPQSYTLTFADSVTEEGKVSPNLSPVQTKSVVYGTPLADQAIENPTSGRKGYNFSNWYLDPSCTKAVDFKNMTMPDHDLTIYAGWEVEWYMVNIDPNYGELRPLNEQGKHTGTGSTWFWQTIEREPIAEYNYVERNYVESSSGTFYYVYHPGDGAGGSEWPNRYTYYTTNISEATEDTTFEYSPGTYTYAGWYEVLDDGTEVPYVFGERTDHNTNLKLHWKKNGVYYLRYNAAIDGASGTMDDADASGSLLADGKYADYAEITLTHAAIAPNGYTFVGWQVRGSDSNVIYTPGQTFTLNAEDAKRVSGKDVVYLDAVYARVGTASITYDANGGTVAGSGVDFGQVPNPNTDASQSNPWLAASGTVDTAAGTATVSGLENNSKLKLSDGTGFTAPAGTSFIGWSNKAVCDESATFYDRNSTATYAVNAKAPKTLYAVWGTKVTYHLSPDADGEWGSTEWDSSYTKEDGAYSQTVKLGTAVAEPENVPVYTGTDNYIFRYWATRTGSGSDEDPYVYKEYDFSQPVTGALDLYAHWDIANIVQVHAVDASQEVLADKTGVDGWTVNDVLVTTDEVDLTATSHVTAPDNYEFAFVAASSDPNSVSESNAVTAIKYENNRFKVKYKGESSFRALGADKYLYFVYYQKKTRKIGYKSMGANGVLVNVTPGDGAPQITGMLGEYDMSSQIAAPLNYASGFTNYAFAIGSVDPENGTEMNASNLSLITDVAGTTDTAPKLRIRNSWRGFQYTTESGDDAEWNSCGYDPQLYVIYYTQKPTVVMFHEKTVGTSSMMSTKFTFNLKVTEATTTTTSVQTQIKNDSGEWEDRGDPTVTETTGDPVMVFDTTEAGNQPYILENGESNSAILFYSSSTQKDEPELVDKNTQTITTTTTTTAQTAVITQTVNDDFTTIVKADGNYEAETLSFTCSTDGKGGTKNVTFTNIHKSLLPRIKYVKEASDGTLTDITGSIVNTTTGVIGPSESVTYSHETLKMNGRTVEQGQYLEVTQSGRTISQKGNKFRMPPVLDDGLFERYLGYNKIGAAGNREAASINTLDVSTGLDMQLKIDGDTLKYSFDGETWKDFNSDTPTIYAIYSERGYDLQISKTVDMSQSGENALFSGSSFPVTIRSMEITKNSYDAEGADSSTISATPAEGTEPGTITMTVTDGTKVRIKGLGRGEYTITESGNENYTLTAKTGPIVGSLTTPMMVADNTMVSFTLGSEKKVDLTNSPKAICKIDDHYFYTLRSMVAYVDENIATKTATAEMLTDYLMPAADTVEIPSDFNITLTTIEDPDVMDHPAVISRTADLAAVPLFTSNGGSLTITNMMLEGNSIKATAPMIQSAGNLTIGSGAMIQNCVGGGAINATAGNITVSGTIQNCSADEGGAIYHSGNSTITLNGTGVIQNNSAASGDGGAIWLGGGLVTVSGTSRITGNKAESGKGGAIFANSVVEIEIDQGGAITGNTATEGGAIYAKETAMINISEAENLTVQPNVSGNTATTGNGGAIYVNGGSISVSGGSVSSNKAENGQGGAIYSSTASVTVSGTAEVKNNTAKEGGAVHSVSGTVTVSETTNTTTTTDDEGNETTTVTVLSPAISGNTASTGNGGAIYVGSGNVTVSGGSMTQNNATAGSGGAIYADSGSVTVSGGSMSKNTAKNDGGAVFAGSGSITVSASNSGTALTIQGNKAESGKGGALYTNSGAVSITGTALTQNAAGTDGGAVYAGSGAVTLTNSTFGGDAAGDGNTSGGSGGAVYAGSSNVTVSGGSMKNNKSTGGDGGAFYAGSGTVTVSGYTVNESTSYTQFVSNSATAGKGGAVYLDSGSLTLTSVTAEDNSAINGAAIFMNTGRASFSDGSCSGNVASSGGAVGVGSTDARLVFTGNVQIKNNKLGTGDDAPKSNVYLNQDDDAVVNIDTLGGSAAIGIYVPDAVVPTRSVPGARFAVYTSHSNANRITNDRYPLLTVQSDTSAKKLYWGNSIKVSVHKLDSYGSDFTQPANSGAGAQLGKYDNYYPEFSDAAVSELASELVIKNKLDIGTKVYGGAYLDGERSFGDYITKLTWVKEKSEWYVTTRSGAQVSLTKPNGNYRIYIYYAEPAYLSIENNTDMALTISGMTVGGTSVINSDTVAGYGMVYAKNGAIRSALLPVTAEDLQLSAGQSINLLIPGGRNKAYMLDGSFETTTGGSVRLRRGAETSLSEETVTVSATDGTFEQLTDRTLNAAGTYNIIFGDNKIICKVVDARGTEHPYSKISDALADIVATTGTNPPYTLKKEKTATIEMVTDYLLTASDDVNIPQGYDITLTTAAKEGATYCYNGSGDRATISRDTLNTDSMIKGWNALENNKVVTTLRLNNIIFDGKSVRGSSDGGAVATQYTNVYIDTVDFKNVYASNGGALLVMFNFDKRPDHTKDAKDILPDTVLEVKDSDFTGCTSTTTVKSNRLGGGAIVTNAETMTLEDCDFTSCTAVDQAGAVFHRVDKDNNSWTKVSGCSFINCSANAAGGLELDSKTINVTNCRFEHCVAKERNGGGFNIYALNSATPTADCSVTVSGCTFNDCQLTTTNTSNGNGGGFRCNAVYTKVINSTFTNNQALYGGGFCISNGNAKKGEVYGCTFERNTANQGGGIFGKPKEFIIGDGYYYLDSDQKAVSVLLEDGVYKDLSGNPITDDAILESIQAQNTEIKSCTSVNEGGGVYQARDANGSSLSITNAYITGNRTTANGKNGGGVFTNARTVTIAGSAITDNTSTNLGGGVYANTYTSLSITDSNISRNIASSNGGGVWFYYKDQNNALTIKGSTIDGNTSNNGSGGGIYTEAKTVTIGASETRNDSEDKAIRSSISNNRAKTNGGGIYQSRNVDGSKLDVSCANVNGNTVTGGAGGGIYAGVRTLEITSAEISKNSATGDGGGIWFYIKDTGASMALTVEGSTLDSNNSGGNGGSVYTIAKTVEVKARTEGSAVTKSEISGNTAAKNGGGIYQNLDVEGSMLTISGAIIRNNTANGTGNNEIGGGGVYANVRNMILTNSEVSGNTAKKHGGGIYKNIEGNDYHLIVDNSKVLNNTAGNQGGGIYDKSQLTLRNDTEITGNRLTNNTAENCAGVYLLNNRTLYVGPENAESGYSDTIIVRNNTTANGTLSDLRLWWNSSTSENNAVSVYVYCNLSNNSEIRVVNAAKAGTKFGSAELPLTNGFSDDNPVFKADSSTLYGITDRTDSTNKTIIWAGPPIAKLTDGNGRLLYLKYYEGTATYPAIFDRLDTGNNSVGSTASPFSMLRMDNLTLYYKDGSVYDGSDFCIKMLVEHYETSADMTLPYVEGRTVTFTTAEKSFPSDWPYTEADLDTYHFEGRAGGRATVIRGKSVAGNRTLMNVNGTLNLENIVIDGGTENGVNVTNSTRCMYINEANCTVTIGENAVLQNGIVSSGNNGGGIFLNYGTLNINGGTIRNCTAGNDGGGVYLNNGSMTITAGSIYQCTANGSGGGVRTKNGTFTMTGGTIQGCSSTSTSSGGGGVCIAGGQSMYMSGGSIINNSAQKTGGGIMVYSDASRLYFSGKVNISGNTSEASKATNKACNVELNQDFNGVINTTGDGLYPGAYIGVYVPDGTTLYDKHGVERKPFGNFKNQNSQTNTTNFYSFVNDRNGLKGGIIEKTDPNYVKTGDYADCCIYWIQIFSLQITKQVVSGASTTVDPNELFLFKVDVRGDATVVGQLNAKDIDSSTGDYGEMQFTSNGSETTTAIFGLVDGQTISGVNLSEGLTYEVTEYLTVDQAKRYAAMPMNGARSTTEPLEYNGVTYQVIRANSFASTIGENKTRTDVDPYTSALTFSNLMPVCKITDMSGNLLYRRYDWDKVTNKTGEGQDGGSSTNQPYYYAPAVFTELTGDNGAFKALEGTLYRSNGSNPISYSVSNGVQIQMLIGEYTLSSKVTADTSKVTLTTASASDTLFPKQDPGSTSTIRRAFGNGSMFDVSGDLTLATIILDGAKGAYTVNANGGIANVLSGGNLTIQNGATLQNSKTAEGYNGGAVYVASSGTVTMTGGTVNHNESVGNGAGIYLAEGSTLNLSGAPNFGGTGTNVSGNITATNGNFKTGALVAKLNGGKTYNQARQDIFIAGYEADNEETYATSLVVNGVLKDPDNKNNPIPTGSIWVWAEKTPHYKSLQQFAKLDNDLLKTENGKKVIDTSQITEEQLNKTLEAFRNARPDNDTGADQVGEYLYGFIKGDDTEHVYWYGVEGSRRVILRKVASGTYQSLQGAKFEISTSPGGSPAKDKEGKDLRDLTSGAGGAFYIGELNYGTYYVKETQVPAGYQDTSGKYFIITVSEDGVGYKKETDTGAEITREVTARTPN